MVGLTKIRVITLPPSKGDMLRKIIFGIFVLLISSPCYTNAQKPKGSLSIGFNHYVDSLLLKLDSVEYKNELGQTYNVTKFKYYISNIHLTKSNGKEYVSKDYYLINEEEETSKKIILKDIPEGEYVKLSFTVGVDSARNCSGAQSGALDPINGMFWIWNTGYIFLKLEGKAAASTAPGKIFEYHIGGYKDPNHYILKIFFPMKKTLLVEQNKTAELNIRVNVAEILKEPTSIDFSKTPTVTEPKNSKVIFDNYMDAFSLEK